MIRFKQWFSASVMAIGVMILTPAAHAEAPKVPEKPVEAKAVEPVPPAATPPPTEAPPQVRPSTPLTDVMPKNRSSNAAPSEGTSGSGAWKNALMVLFFLGALGGAAWYVKKKRIEIPGVRGGGSLRVLDTVRVGQQAYLVTAYVGGRVLLLGVSEAGIRRLAWLKPDTQVEPDAEMELRSPILPQSPRAGEGKATSAMPRTIGGFAEALKGLLAARPNQSVAQDELSDGEEPNAPLPDSLAVKDRFERSHDDVDERRQDERREERGRDDRSNDDRRRDERSRYDRPRDEPVRPAATRRYEVADEPAEAKAPQTTAEFLASKARDVPERRPARTAAQPRTTRGRSDAERTEPKSEVRMSQPPAEVPRAAAPSVPPSAPGVEGQVNGLRRRAGRQR